MADDVRVSTEIPVDDETRAALLLFNERIEQSAADDRAAKRVAKAERAKDEAAATVRKLGGSTSASPEDKAEAEEAYKAAVASYNEIKDDPHAPEREAAAKAKAEAEAREAAKAEKAAAAEAESAETPDDEMPADEAPEEAASDTAEPAEPSPADDSADGAAPTETSADEEEAPAATATEAE